MDYFPIKSSMWSKLPLEIYKGQFGSSYDVMCGLKCENWLSIALGMDQSLVLGA